MGEATRERRRAAGLCVQCGKRPSSDGMLRCRKCRALNKAQRQTPKRKAWYRARAKDPKFRAKERARFQTPQFKAANARFEKSPKRKARRRAYRRTPEYRARCRMLAKAPKQRARRAAYFRTPEYRAFNRERTKAPNYLRQVRVRQQIRYRNDPACRARMCARACACRHNRRAQIMGKRRNLHSDGGSGGQSARGQSLPALWAHSYSHRDGPPNRNHNRPRGCYCQWRNQRRNQRRLVTPTSLLSLQFFEGQSPPHRLPTGGLGRTPQALTRR